MRRLRLDVAVDAPEEVREAAAEVHAHPARVTDLEDALELALEIALVPVARVVEVECGRLLRLRVDLGHASLGAEAKKTRTRQGDADALRVPIAHDAVT